MNLKMYFYIAIAIGLVGLLWRFEYLSSKVTSQKLEIDQGSAREAAYALNIERQEVQIKLANDLQQKYLTDLGAANDETNRIKRCVNDGTCILRIKSRCPRVPETTTNTGATITDSAEFDREAEQSYYDLRESINIVQSNLDLCIKTLQNDRLREETSKP